MLLHISPWEDRNIPLPVIRSSTLERMAWLWLAVDGHVGILSVTTYMCFPKWDDTHELLIMDTTNGRRISSRNISITVAGRRPSGISAEEVCCDIYVGWHLCAITALSVQVMYRLQNQLRVVAIRMLIFYSISGSYGRWQFAKLSYCLNTCFLSMTRA